MNVLFIKGEIFDLHQVSSTDLEPRQVKLTFKNGDVLPLQWRDESERTDILRALGMANPPVRDN